MWSLASWLSRKDVDEPWEVVDSKGVESVSMYDDLEDDLDVVRVHDMDISALYTFDREICSKHEQHLESDVDLHKALLHARSRLLRDVSRLGYNILLTEGWCITLSRKSERRPKPAGSSHDHRHSHYRVSIRYTGRPAYVHDPPARPKPPFLPLLDMWQQRARQEYMGVIEESGVSSDEHGLAEQRENIPGKGHRRGWSFIRRLRVAA